MVFYTHEDADRMQKHQVDSFAIPCSVIRLDEWCARENGTKGA